MGTVDLTVAVLTYQGEQLLPDCLASLQGQEVPPSWELLIVDDHSTTPPQVLLPHRLVVHERNLGNIAGTNTCFREARGRYVLFMANDVRLRPNCLKRLQLMSRYDIVQPVLLQPDGEVDNVGLRWHWPGYGARVRREGERTDAFANTCYLMKRSTWQMVGEFDEGLGISHEDIDFSLRATRMGYTIGHCPSAYADHLMGQTIGRVVKKPLSPFYRAARRRVLQRNYRGMGRLTRLLATGLLDTAASTLRR